MKKNRIYGVALAAIVFATLPLIAFGQREGLVQCTEKCGFKELLELVNRVIDFLMLQIAVPLATLAFAYAGWKLFTSQGDPGALGKAKDIGWTTLWGFGIAMSAWLVVKLVFDFFLDPSIRTFL